MSEKKIEGQGAGFSLLSGGLLFRLLRWSRLSGEELEPIQWRVIAFSVFTWVPLAVLSYIDGNAFVASIDIPFFRDIAVHSRFLIALPILVGAEAFVHRRIRWEVDKFLERKIIPSDQIPEFNRAIDSAHKIRDSVWLEAMLLVSVYTVGLWIWKSQISLEVPSWYATPDQSGLNLTSAGYWFVFVSVPLFQFILVRWYLRFFTWFWFLFRVSRLKLNLIPTNYDRSAGLGFLTYCTYAFGSILFAQGVLLSGLIASESINGGKSILDYKMAALGFIIVFVAAVFSPLTVFIPALLRAKREGLKVYGNLATQYVEEFDKKWAQGEMAPDEEFLGSGDIQSLADLGTGYSVVEEMTWVPFSLRAVINLAIVAALPLLPLVLLVFSPEELFESLVHVLF